LAIVVPCERSLLNDEPLQVDDATPQGDSDRLGSVAGPELRKNVSDVHLDCVFRDGKFDGDLFVSLPSRNQRQHLKFAWADHITGNVFRQRLRNCRRKPFFSSVNRADDLQQLFANHPLYNVTLGSCVQGAADVNIAFMGAQDNHSGVWRFRFDLFDYFEAAYIGEAEIHQNYIGTQGPKLLKPIAPRWGCACYGHVRLKIDDGGKPVANRRMIVYT
jgi:hypothetical protein